MPDNTSGSTSASTTSTDLPSDKQDGDEVFLPPSGGEQKKGTNKRKSVDKSVEIKKPPGRVCKKSRSSMHPPPRQAGSSSTDPGKEQEDEEMTAPPPPEGDWTIAMARMLGGL